MVDIAVFFPKSIFKYWLNAVEQCYVLYIGDDLRVYGVVFYLEMEKGFGRHLRFVGI